jgi:hypothetical protein
MIVDDDLRLCSDVRIQCDANTPLEVIGRKLSHRCSY